MTMQIRKPALPGLYGASARLFLPVFKEMLLYMKSHSAKTHFSHINAIKQLEKIHQIMAVYDIES